MGCGASKPAAAEQTKEPEVKATRGFLVKVAEAEAAIGKDNILEPAKAKEFIDANAQCLLLDVQDPGSDMVPGSYNASLGTLFFNASTDLPEFKDPKIADRPKDAPILVNCAVGGQAKLGAKILIDYGFTNVKVIDGGCVAWKKADLGSVSPCSEIKGEDTKAGFLAKVSEAEAAIRTRNILEPEKAKMYMDMPSSACLLLDVQDPGGDVLPGFYSVSLGTLFFKADNELPEFNDPKIAEWSIAAPILVNCAVGGQAKLAAKILLDYGFANVKVIDGGCAAYKKAGL